MAIAVSYWEVYFYPQICWGRKSVEYYWVRGNLSQSGRVKTEWQQGSCYYLRWCRDQKELYYESQSEYGS